MSNNHENGSNQEEVSATFEQTGPAVSNNSDLLQEEQERTSIKGQDALPPPQQQQQQQQQQPNQLTITEEDLNRINEQLLNEKELNYEHKAKIKKLLAENSKLCEQVQIKETELKTVAAALSANGEYKSAQDLRNENDQLKEENSLLTASCNSLKEQIAATSATADAPSRDAGNSNAAHEEVLNELINALSSKDKEIETFQSKIKELQDLNTEANGQIDQLIQRFKRDERRLKSESAAREHDITQKFEDQIKILSAKLSDSTAASTEEQEEKIRLANRKKAQAQSMLAATQESLNKSKAQVELYEKQMAELTEKLKESDDNYKLKVVEFDEVSKISKQLNAKHNEVEMKLMQVTSENSSLKESLEGAKRLSLQSSEENKLLLSQVQSLKNQLSDQAVEYKIASKKNITLIKDLKSSLQKEHANFSKLQQQMLSMQKDEEALRAEINSKETTIDKQSRQIAIFEQQLETNESVPIDSSMSSSQTDNIMKALAARLESLLNENQVVREKVTLLEGNIQSLTVELNDKKALLKQMEADRLNSNPFARVHAFSSPASSPKHKDEVEL